MEANFYTMDKHVITRRTLQVKSIFRLTIFITLVLILIICLLSSFLLKGKAAEVPDYYLSFDVAEGDTLWSIAEGSVPRGRDIRDYISEIKELNGLKTSNIIAGQQLQIPIYHESGNSDSAVKFGMNQ